MNNKRFWEIVAKMIVAALTAALTAVTTTSCMATDRSRCLRTDV